VRKNWWSRFRHNGARKKVHIRILIPQITSESMVADIDIYTSLSPVISLAFLSEKLPFVLSSWLVVPCQHPFASMVFAFTPVLPVIDYGGWWTVQTHGDGFLKKMAYIVTDTDAIAYCLCSCCFVWGSGAGEPSSWLLLYGMKRYGHFA